MLPETHYGRLTVQCRISLLVECSIDFCFCVCACVCVFVLESRLALIYWSDVSVALFRVVNWYFSLNLPMLHFRFSKVSLSELFTRLMATVSSYGIMPFTVTVILFMNNKGFSYKQFLYVQVVFKLWENINYQFHWGKKGTTGVRFWVYT